MNMPLEQFQGKAKLCSDIYALGASLYFVLTSCDPTPFSESDPMDGGAIISEALNELVLDCTRVRPDERIASVEELVERLSELQVSMY